MGFGGILASIAHGLGGGMREVAHEGWRKQEQDRKLDALSKERAIERDHEMAKLDKVYQQRLDLLEREEAGLAKHRNAIRQAVSKTLSESENQKSINGIKDALDAVYSGKQAIAALDERLSNTNLSDKSRAELLRQRTVMEGHLKSIADDDSIWGNVIKGKYGQNLYSKYLQEVDPFKTRTEQTQTKAQPATTSSVSVPRPRYALMGRIRVIN